MTTRVAATPMCVLLVEDDDASADFVIDAFAEAPGLACVVRVVRLQDALQQLAKLPVDVVLLDLTLPDAFDLLGINAIRSAAPDVALVVLTGSLDAALSDRATAAGADDYLQKHLVDAKLLVRSISYARDRRACMSDANESATKPNQEGRGNSNGPLDVEAMMAAAAAAALPKFAAWCGVQIRDDDGLIHNAHVGDRPVPPMPADDTESVMQRGRPSPLDARTLIVPLLIRGRVRGTFQLARSEDAAPYCEDDLELALELARRAALMFESARLYNTTQATIEHRAVFRFITTQELRKPLSMLQIQIDRMQRMVQATANKVGPARDAVARMKRLATTLGQIRAGNLVIDAGEMDLAELAVEVVHRYREETKNVSSTVGLLLPGTTRALGIWDRLLLENLMTSLLDHADKHGAGKPIELCVVTEADVATLSVRDHGIGIADPDLARIFDRFELHVSRQIVEAHGGSINVESELGNGSSVTVRLPCKPAASPPVVAATA